jgi:hypothetical protein
MNVPVVHLPGISEGHPLLTLAAGEPTIYSQTQDVIGDGEVSQNPNIFYYQTHTDLYAQVRLIVPICR